MLESLSLIILVGLSMAAIVQKLKLPRIIGLLATGIILGPYVLNFLDPTILSISSELRQIALIIILIKAGLSLNLSDLKKVGRPAVLMAFLPATFEIAAYTLFAPVVLGISRVDAMVMGAVLGAVSPAVVVPRMVSLIENKYGTEKGIPQMILAGASCDDIFVIVLFTTFLNMAKGGSADIMDFVNVPVSIVLGVIAGTVAGFILGKLFEYLFSKGKHIRNSMKIIIIMGSAFALMTLETIVKKYVSLSGLLAVVSMACTLKIVSDESVIKRLSEKMGKLWLMAEILLFVLVGAAVDVRYTLKAGLPALAMIFIALGIRAIGVYLCVVGTKLTAKERLFCVLSYLPKATVQAAIGSVPMAMGLSCGQIVLSVAVMGILITAPLGAISMDMSYKKLLEKES